MADWIDRMKADLVNYVIASLQERAWLFLRSMTLRDWAVVVLAIGILVITFKILGMLRRLFPLLMLAALAILLVPFASVRQYEPSRVSGTWRLPRMAMPSLPSLPRFRMSTLPLPTLPSFTSSASAPSPKPRPRHQFIQEWRPTADPVPPRDPHNAMCAFCRKPMIIFHNMLGENVRCGRCKQIMSARRGWWTYQAYVKSIRERRG